MSSQQLEALVKMAPTKEEEEKLSNYQGNIDELGSAEKFVMAILNIPFAFSRIQVMLYKETLEDEVVHLKKSFAILEVRTETCSVCKLHLISFVIIIVFPMNTIRNAQIRLVYSSTSSSFTLIRKK